MFNRWKLYVVEIQPSYRQTTTQEIQSCENHQSQRFRAATSRAPPLPFDFPYDNGRLLKSARLSTTFHNHAFVMVFR